VLTVGAASTSSAAKGSGILPAGVLAVHDAASVVPAVSSAAGPGAYRAIKPDVIAVGGRHDVRASSISGNLNLRVANALPASGLLSKYAYELVTRSPTRRQSLAYLAHGGWGVGSMICPANSFNRVDK